MCWTWLKKIWPTPVPPAPPSPPAPVPTVDQRLLDAVNSQRKSYGLLPLALHDDLNHAAQLHSEDMADHENFSHTGSDGSDPGRRMVAAGYRPSAWGECIAEGYSSAQAVVAGWMKDGPHRKILLGYYTHIGFGVANAANGLVYWTADFGTQS